jgi:hypothetical protein
VGPARVVLGQAPAECAPQDAHGQHAHNSGGPRLCREALVSTGVCRGMWRGCHTLVGVLAGWPSQVRLAPLDSPVIGVASLLVAS